MREYRCFVPEAQAEGQTLSLPAEEARHLVQVLRAGPGREVLLLDGAGKEWAAQVAEAGRRAATVRVMGISRQTPPPPPRWLACAPTKSAQFDDVVQQAVELGMTAFHPLRTERTEVHFDGPRAAKKLERWRRLAAEAIKQCERLWLPEFHPPIGLAEHLALAEGHALRRMVLVERLREGAPGLAGAAAAGDGVCLYVGPEGGWTEGERKLFATMGAEAVSLGTEAVLRTGTAALAGLAQLTAQPNQGSYPPGP